MFSFGWAPLGHSYAEGAGTVNKQKLGRALRTYLDVFL